MKRMMFTAMLLGTALLFSGCATAIGTSPKGEELPIEKAAITFADDVKDGGYRLLSADDLKKMLSGKNDFILIDTMPGESFAKGHIKGAVNGPMPKSEKELTPADKDVLLKAAGDDKEKTIVTYCGFVACRRSHIAAKILTDSGFRNVSRYPAGIVGWKEAGYPLE